MTKEKFDRNKKPRNIGEIGRSDIITHNDYARTMLTFQYFEEEDRKRNVLILEDLIEKYGLEAGYKKYMELMEERRKENSIYISDDKPRSRKIVTVQTR